MQPSPAELAWQIALNNLDLRDAVAVLGAMLHAPALLKSVQPAAAVVREQYLREVDRALAFGLCWSSVFWRQPLQNFHTAHLGSVVSHCLKTPVVVRLRVTNSPVHNGGSQETTVTLGQTALSVRTQSAAGLPAG